ncbi:hypothetical protein KAREA_49090 [Prescottella equi]|nr:hypothetical protein KAREA_49090 [Prescottella equi]
MTTPPLCHSDGCRYITRHPSGHCPDHQKAAMRVQPVTFSPRVTRGRNSRRPITLAVAGLTFTLSEPEARNLADELVDATETPTPKSSNPQAHDSPAPVRQFFTGPRNSRAKGHPRHD